MGSRWSWFSSLSSSSLVRPAVAALDSRNDDSISAPNMASGPPLSPLFHILYSGSSSNQNGTSNSPTIVPHPHPENVGEIIGGVLGGLSFILSITALIVIYRRRKKVNRLESGSESGPLSSMWKPGFNRVFFPTGRAGNHEYYDPSKRSMLYASNRSRVTTQSSLDMGETEGSVAAHSSPNTFTHRVLPPVPATLPVPCTTEQRRRVPSPAPSMSPRQTVSHVPSITRHSNEVNERGRNAQVLPPLLKPQHLGRSITRTRPSPNREDTSRMGPVLLTAPGDSSLTLSEPPSRRRHHKSDQLGEKPTEIRPTELMTQDEIKRRIREWQEEVAAAVPSPSSNEIEVPPPAYTAYRREKMT